MAGTMLPPVILELRAKAGELMTELGAVKKELGEIDKKSTSTGTRMGRAFSGITAGSKALMTGILGAGVVVGAFGVEAATTAEVADTRLRIAITNAGGSFEKFHVQIEDADKAGRAFGFTNADVNTALATMTLGLHSPTKALEFLGVAENLARQKGLGLNEAALLVTKGFEGQTRPLKALGIDLPVYAGNAHAVQIAQMALAKAQEGVNKVLAKYPDAANAASKGHAAYLAATEKVRAAQLKLSAVQSSGQQIVDALRKRTEGAAKAYGETFAGKLQIARAQMDNLGERIGFFLIPKLEALMTITSKTITWLGKHKDVVYGLSAALMVALVPAILSVTLALLASPITWIALGVGALVIGILLLAKHWSRVWGDIKKWTGEAAQFIRKWWFLILAVPIVGWLLVLAANWRTVWNVIMAIVRVAASVIRTIFGYIRTYLDTLVSGAQWWGRMWNATWDFVKKVISGASGVIGAVIGGIRGVINGIVGAIKWFGQVWSDTWGWITGVVSGAVGGILSAIGGVVNAVSTAASAVASFLGSGSGPVNAFGGSPGPGGHPFGKAGGGPLNLSGWNMVGEEGPELVGPGGYVYPMNRGSSKMMTMGLGRSTATSGGPAHGGGGGSSGGCNCGDITIELDGRVLARAVRNQLLQYGGRNPAGKTSPTYRR